MEKTLWDNRDQSLEYETTQENPPTVVTKKKKKKSQVATISSRSCRFAGIHYSLLRIRRLVSRSRWCCAHKLPSRHCVRAFLLQADGTRDQTQLHQTTDPNCSQIVEDVGAVCVWACSRLHCRGRSVTLRCLCFVGRVCFVGETRGAPPGRKSARQAQRYTHTRTHALCEGYQPCVLSAAGQVRLHICTWENSITWASVFFFFLFFLWVPVLGWFEFS